LQHQTSDKSHVVYDDLFVFETSVTQPKLPAERIDQIGGTLTIRPQLLAERPTVCDVGAQVEPLVVEDDAAASALQPTRAESVHGTPGVETVQVTRPSTLQEFVDGMRLAITGALLATPKNTRVSKQRDDTIVPRRSTRLAAKSN
jgi:hypothetical protein